MLRLLLVEDQAGNHHERALPGAYRESGTTRVEHLSSMITSD